RETICCKADRVMTPSPAVQVMDHYLGDILKETG
ncbi:hypothetical protein PSYMO_38523, partial [Pseudomonas amygdali pv. mori str. 301020]